MSRKRPVRKESAASLHAQAGQGALDNPLLHLWINHATNAHRLEQHIEGLGWPYALRPKANAAARLKDQHPRSWKDVGEFYPPAGETMFTYQDAQETLGIEGVEVSTHVNMGGSQADRSRWPILFREFRVADDEGGANSFSGVGSDNQQFDLLDTVEPESPIWNWCDGGDSAGGENPDRSLRVVIWQTEEIKSPRTSFLIGQGWDVIRTDSVHTLVGNYPYGDQTIPRLAKVVSVSDYYLYYDQEERDERLDLTGSTKIKAWLLEDVGAKPLIENNRLFGQVILEHRIPISEFAQWVIRLVFKIEDALYDEVPFSLKYDHDYQVSLFMEFQKSWVYGIPVQTALDQDKFQATRDQAGDLIVRLLSRKPDGFPTVESLFGQTLLLNRPRDLLHLFLPPEE